MVICFPAMIGLVAIRATVPGGRGDYTQNEAIALPGVPIDGKTFSFVCCITLFN